MADNPTARSRIAGKPEPAWLDKARRVAMSDAFKGHASVRCFARANKYGPLISLRDAIGITMEFARFELLDQCAPPGVALPHSLIQQVAKCASIGVATSHFRISAAVCGSVALPMTVQAMEDMLARFMTWWANERIAVASAGLDQRLTERQLCIREVLAPLIERRVESSAKLRGRVDAAFKMLPDARIACRGDTCDRIRLFVGAMALRLNDPRKLAQLSHLSKRGQVSMSAKRIRDLLRGRDVPGGVREDAVDEDAVEAASVPKYAWAAESEVVAAAEARESVAVVRQIRACVAEHAAACAPGSAEHIVLTHFLARAEGAVSMRDLAQQFGIPRRTLDLTLTRVTARLRADPRVSALAQHGDPARAAKDRRAG